MASGMQSSVKASYDCIRQFSGTDFTEDLKKIDVPTLFLHGDADQTVPREDASALVVKLVPEARLKVVPGAPHGMNITIPDQVNNELLAFLGA